MRTKLKNHRGYTLIEAIIYIVVLVIIISAVIGLAVVMIRALDNLRFEREIGRGAQTALERMIREIRSADSINLADSIFNSHPGVLSLITGQNNYRFSVTNGRLTIAENGGSAESLLPERVVVTSLIFRRLVGAVSESIRVEIILGHKAADDKTMPFYATAGLR